MKQQQTPRPTCAKHSEPLTLLCLEPECDKRGLICTHCEFESHPHSVRPLGAVLSEIKRDESAISVDLLSQIDHLYSDVEAEVNKLGKASDRAVLTEMVERYYWDLCSKIRKMSQMSKKIHSRRGALAVEQLNSLLLKYEFADKQENPLNLPHAEASLRGILSSFQLALEELKEGVKGNDSIERLLPIFAMEDGKNIKYFFSEEKKHQDILVIDKYKVQIKQGYTYRIALVDPPIHKEGSKCVKKRSCVFRPTKINSMVGVGVCFRKRAEDLAYVFSAHSQHGCYFLANNGYSYNESDTSFNSQMKNWTYQVNELVKVTVDPKNKKVIFSKENSEPFEYGYEEKQDLEFNFAVMVCSNDESIELVA